MGTRYSTHAKSSQQCISFYVAMFLYSSTINENIKCAYVAMKKSETFPRAYCHYIPEKD